MPKKPTEENLDFYIFLLTFDPKFGENPPEEIILKDASQIGINFTPQQIDYIVQQAKREINSKTK